MTTLPRGEKPIDHFENSHSTSEESQNHNTERQIFLEKVTQKSFYTFMPYLYYIYLKNKFNPFLENNLFFNKQVKRVFSSN